MTTLLPIPKQTEVVYPSSDGEPLAETSVHVDAILTAVVALRQYLADQQAVVLADQFLYYAQGFPRLRVAPDVMVVLGVNPGPRDNFKTWEEGQVPVVIFEMTSESTRSQDQGFKKDLYESLGVQEYWQFDPRGEWIPEQLRGYRLQDEVYVPITDGCCGPLNLSLQIEGMVIGFYRQDTGEKLLAPDELVQALRQAKLEIEEAKLEAEEAKLEAEEAKLEAEEAKLQAQQAESRAERLAARLRALGLDPDALD